MKLVCPDCKQEVRTFVGHGCMDKPKSSGGLAQERLRPGESQPPSVSGAADMRMPDRGGDAPRPPETKLKSKRGRPKAGEQREKPWEALGLSERTYYRRLKETGSVATRKPSSLEKSWDDRKQRIDARLKDLKHDKE